MYGGKNISVGSATVKDIKPNKPVAIAIIAAAALSYLRTLEHEQQGGTPDDEPDCAPKSGIRDAAHFLSLLWLKNGGCLFR